MFTAINLAYAVASTSWLLYWVFTAVCYPAIYITCLFQYEAVGGISRWMLRALLKQLHFIDDKIALFDIPALEIDTEVAGLLVLRGVSVSLSTLSLTVHGVEVGIKLSDDLELSVQTECVNVSLFRSIQVDDCFANIKCGKQGLKQGGLRSKSKETDKGSSATTATHGINGASDKGLPRTATTKTRMTAGNPPKDSSNTAAYKAIKKQPLRSNIAIERYHRTLELLDASNAISQARTYVKQHLTSVDDIDCNNSKLRAGICSQLHSKPSVPNPPPRSVKVTVLRELLPAKIRRFLHRLPMLLRLLLNPLSYLHPVTIHSITVTASGDLLKSVFQQTIFKKNDGSDTELERLREDILSGVTDAHFTVGLGSMTGQARVPVFPSSSILCQLAFDGIVVHRALTKDMIVYEIVKLRGVDASFVVPTCLLPHHEHLIPDEVKPDTDSAHSEVVAVANSADETDDDTMAVKMAVLAHLPATLDQEIINFIALILKHYKLLEMDDSPSLMDDAGKGLGKFSDAVNQKIKDGAKKAVMGGDQWLAKLAGKALTKLQGVDGDLGYSGNIPVDLSKYRMTGWLESEGEKLLP